MGTKGRIKMSKGNIKILLTKVDPKSAKKSGTPTDCIINFSSSPNLKNIKKFSKIKIEDNEPSMCSSTSVKADLSLPLEKAQMEKKVEVQPPLPLDPPPSDQPITDMQEAKEVVEYKKPDVEPQTYQQKSSLPKEIVQSKEIQKPRKRGEPCRDFIRGTCTRLVCNKEHRFDLSEEELQKLYTFCRNYQSTACTRAYCKYVHATVFEEQHFYRTGVLPSHAFAHHAKIIPPPLPPPPPPPPPEEPLNDFKIPPPVLTKFSNIQKPAPTMLNCVPDTTMAARTMPPVEMQNPVTQKVPPLKRDWTAMDAGNTVDHTRHENELDTEKSLVKKCKNCETSQFRLEYKKIKLEKAKASYEDWVKKRVHLEKTVELLDLVLAKLKPGLSDLLNKSSFGEGN